MPRKKKQETEKRICNNCHKELVLNTNYYKSNSPTAVNGRTNICKRCINDMTNVDDMDSVRKTLRLLDISFDQKYWDAALGEPRVQKNKNAVLGVFISKMTSLSQNQGSEYEEESTKTISNLKDDIDMEIEQNQKIAMTDEDVKNKNDVLSLLGYDPFIYEHENDKRHLYNTLIDFLDEGTLRDSFKMPAVIEIVKTFNQIDKLNRSLAILLRDQTTITQNTSGIKSLLDAKDKMVKSILAMAKDNGISVNHNNNKSKGANTLNGIVKKLNEIGLEAGEVNLFDLETSESIKQIADISNRSILDQLMFDENDYTEMISEQNAIIKKLDEKLMKVEEENRLLKIKIKQLETEMM